MAIATDSYIDVEIDEEVVDRIGLSAALTDISDIISSGYCGMHHLLWRNGQTKTDGDHYTVTKKIPVSLSGASFPITVDKGTGDYNYPDGMFCGIVWLYSENSPMDYCINSSNISDYKVVTEWDAPHYVYKPSSLQEAGHWTGKTHLSWSNDDIAGYVWNNGYNNNFMGLEYWDDDEGTNKVEIQHIRPYLMYQNENGSQFLSIYDYSYQATFFYADTDTYAATTTLKDYTDSENIAFCVAIDSLGSPNILPVTGSNYGFVNAEGMSVNDQFGVFFKTDSSMIVGHNGYLAYSSEYAFHFKDDVFTDIAGCGLKFYTDKLYKPIISGGVVIGYTDDMEEKSELDEWKGSTDHGIGPTPPTPPTPPIDPWDVDPETYGWSGGEVSGMVKYYLLTSGQMGELQSAIASNANWTIDYLNCVVSCFVVPNSGIFFDAPINTTVKFVVDNATKWDTGVACKRIQGTINKSGGTIEIPRLTNTFYDFEPYSDYSVYIPFCGRIPIKGNVCLGREIKVTYYPDVPTCSLTAVVSCGGATIAIAKGSFGTMTPVTSNGSDRKTAAVIGDVAPIITGIGTGIVGVALGNPLIVGAGAAQALGGIMGGVKETVQSYAYSVGSTGDSSFFGAGNRCFYYANYPLIDSVVNNSMFGHSVGYLCNTVGKLSDFKGFTICANPHVTFSATSEEREEIERLLSMGVIL